MNNGFSIRYYFITYISLFKSLLLCDENAELNDYAYIGCKKIIMGEKMSNSLVCLSYFLFLFGFYHFSIILHESNYSPRRFYKSTLAIEPSISRYVRVKVVPHDLILIRL